MRTSRRILNKTLSVAAKSLSLIEFEHNFPCIVNFRMANQLLGA